MKEQINKYCNKARLFLSKEEDWCIDIDCENLDFCYDEKTYNIEEMEIIE
jgi:hypothetical protein